MAEPDLYDILGVKKGASEGEIKKVRLIFIHFLYFWNIMVLWFKNLEAGIYSLCLFYVRLFAVVSRSVENSRDHFVMEWRK